MRELELNEIAVVDGGGVIAVVRWVGLNLLWDGIKQVASNLDLDSAEADPVHYYNSLPPGVQ